jgi:hypothetical protein
MKNMKLEMFVDKDNRHVHVFRESPAFGDVGSLSRGHLQAGVLNDGVHRVKFGVYNATMSMDAIKAIARAALTAKGE